MTDEHFEKIAEKYYNRFSKERIDFLKKMSKLIDEHEQSTYEVIGTTITFDLPNPISLVWNGERFVG
jgi:Zn-finger domain-containing protein